MNQTRLSIVIACYNDPYVVEAIASARNQTYANKEIIVIDDGSDASVQKIIDSQKDEVDQIIRQENSGQSIARNNGISKASGDLILNLDSDDFFEPEFCHKAVDILSTDSEVKIVTCKAKRIYNGNTIDIFTPAGGDYKSFLYSNSALGSSMFRKSDWERVGGYEEELPILGFEDWELYLNILKDGGTAKVIDEVLFNYRLRKESTTQRIKNLRNKKFQYIIIKHHLLYKDHFKDTVDHLFTRMNKLQEDNFKIKKGMPHKTGEFILKPFKFLKRKLS